MRQNGVSTSLAHSGSNHEQLVTVPVVPTPVPSTEHNQYVGR